jgi:class 3 adenylate cyclase/8-oxo-dGTP pyrophosphatase MutT (NUDIX family)
MYEYAMAIFVDLRGFTKWSNLSAVAPHLQNFMIDFYNIFYHMKGEDNTWYFKPNGDGVMIVRSSESDHQPLNSYLEDFLNNKIPYIYQRYKTFRQEYHVIMRCDIPLNLGFGISAGLVYRVEYPIANGVSLIDFASSTLNTAARLCDQARPEGIVIDADAFPGWLPSNSDSYKPCKVSLKGLSDDIPVWVSYDLFKTPAPRELRRVFNQEFHVGTVCYDPSRELLVLAKRQNNRELFPGLWETGGGQIYEGEDIMEAAKRLAESEFALKINEVGNASFIPYKIIHKGRIIPGIKVLCLFENDQNPKLIDNRQHSEVRLVSPNSIKLENEWPSTKMIPKSKNDILSLLNSFKR